MSDGTQKRPSGIKQFERSAAVERLEPIGTGLTIALNGLNDFNDLAAGFGSLAKVLEPASLVAEIKEDLQKSLRSYGVGMNH